MITAAFLRYLNAQGLVVFGTTGTNAFLEELPDQPDVAVAAYARPGGADTDGGHGYDEPAVQFLVRGGTGTGKARPGYNKAKAIRDALHGLSQITLAPGTPDEVYLIQCLATTSEPTNIGDDNSDRPRWSITVRCEVRNVTPLRG